LNPFLSEVYEMKQVPETIYHVPEMGYLCIMNNLACLFSLHIYIYIYAVWVLKNHFLLLS